MGQISTSLTLSASPEKVFEVATDPSRFGEWMTIHTKWKGDVPTEFTAGAQVTEVITMLGMANTIVWTIDEFDSPKKLRMSGTGMAGVKVEIGIEVASDGNGGSTMNLATSFEGQMIVGALGKAVEKDGQKNLEDSLAKFQALVS